VGTRAVNANGTSCQETPARSNFIIGTPPPRLISLQNWPTHPPEVGGAGEGIEPRPSDYQSQMLTSGATPLRLKPVIIAEGAIMEFARGETCGSNRAGPPNSGGKGVRDALLYNDTKAMYTARLRRKQSRKLSSKSLVDSRRKEGGLPTASAADRDGLPTAKPR